MLIAHSVLMIVRVQPAASGFPGLQGSLGNALSLTCFIMGISPYELIIGSGYVPVKFTYSISSSFKTISAYQGTTSRYQTEVPNVFVVHEAQHCTVDHTLICKRGPFVNWRHNRLRGVIAELLNKCLPEVLTMKFN